MNTAQTTEDKERRYRRYLWLKVYSMKQHLLANATVVDDEAIRFVNENRTRGHYMSIWMILGLDLPIK
ncbi:MAG: hypothetical protein WBL88_06740 [Nitrososphaeraceae archaeon]